MASSRKRPKGKRIAVALSGGIDSVVLLHLLKSSTFVTAIHVHHGLSPNADRWAAFCRRLCKRWDVPLLVKKVNVRKSGKGLEAAARAARYEVFTKTDAHCIALAHNLDDQAETVLMNLLRGAGARGGAGMRPESKFEGKVLLRPLLGTPRKAIEAYAKAHALEWVEDESNADEALTRNFVRRSLGPLLEKRFPSWKESLARAARHFSKKALSQEHLLRAFLRDRGLKAPSEAKLVEMLKQLASGGARTSIAHDGVRLRVYRDKVSLASAKDLPFTPLEWKGEASVRIAALGGELRFRAVRGRGIAFRHKPLRIRLRRGGERLQLLVCGDDLVWVPGVGVDIRYRAAPKSSGWLPEWRKMSR
jgi:tRNA(Ile)-lysidine synthase